jgi:histidinol phosphatase-like enzyme
VQTALSAALDASGARLDAVLACAYHADGREPLRIAAHPWRKPNPGMIFAAAGRMKLDLSASWIVGDKVDDLATGAAAGLAGGTLLAANEDVRRHVMPLASERFVVASAKNLADAVAGLIDAGRLVVRL